MISTVGMKLVVLVVVGFAVSVLVLWFAFPGLFDTEVNVFSVVSGILTGLGLLIAVWEIVKTRTIADEVARKIDGYKRNAKNAFSYFLIGEIERLIPEILLCATIKNERQGVLCFQQFWRYTRELVDYEDRVEKEKIYKLLTRAEARYDRCRREGKIDEKERRKNEIRDSLNQIVNQLKPGLVKAALEEPK